MLEPLTGVEDGVKVNAKSLKGREGKSPNLAFLKGLNIFYVGGDLTFASETTRKRMNYIHAKGGTVVPEYDPNFVTHIITEAGEGVTLRALGLKKLSEIPSEIPTLTWKWINSAKTMDHEFLYAAFKSRVDAGKQLSSRGKGKQKTGATERTPLPRAPSTAAASGLEVENHPDPVASNDVEPKDDPLAEFEALARAERDAEVCSSADKVREEELGSVMTADVQTPSGSDVQSPSLAQSTNCVNQDIIDTLTELMGLHDAKMGQEDKWRVFSYKKAIQSLRSCSERISSIQQARSLRGVGEKTAMKIMEIVETGKLRRIDYERTADIAVVKLFEGIYNVGQRTAYAWYAAGCRTLEDVENGKGGVKLSEAQEIGLRYYKDINTRIPRDEVDEIFPLSIDSKVFIRCMGSYRRGKATCGDIDILITRPTDDGKTHHGMLPLLMAELHTARILTEDLSVSSSDSLETVYHGLCMPFDRRSSDILTVPWECRGAALIYYTGDDIFNRSLRLKASKMGFSLNQRGLFAGVVRSPEDRTVKLSPGNIIASETEEDIFRILGVPWQEPHERVRG
ncbi:Nucleotidyltransferase [Artomyces pyxidatus]|uniref:Nucleotidyltransferase n=1 Tax=Artomyces pyxidatus TaxID=48021 RepID=A0ACB8SM23_9AGAM|nr:Nucleotidyltransferase [Artomyces pyxidatus]